MMIQEIKLHAGDSNNLPHAHIAVDGREYLVMGGKGYVTVLAGRQWINSRRALGKTFWSAQALAAHYKMDGQVVLEYANRVTELSK